MADDLRERIRRGDFEALLDPALDLHLLAEPDAEWWRDGLWSYTNALLVRVVGPLLSRGAQSALAQAVDAWGCEHAPGLGWEAEWHVRVQRIERDPSGANPAWRVADAVAGVAQALEGRLPVEWLRLDLARRLRPMLLATPPEIDAALATLARYAPR